MSASMRSFTSAALFASSTAATRAASCSMTASAWYCDSASFVLMWSASCAATVVNPERMEATDAGFFLKGFFMRAPFRWGRGELKGDFDPYRVAAEALDVHVEELQRSLARHGLRAREGDDEARRPEDNALADLLELLEQVVRHRDLHAVLGARVDAAEEVVHAAELVGAAEHRLLRDDDVQLGADLAPLVERQVVLALDSHS